MSAEKSDKVIRLIRKLLDLAGNNSNEHEARSAAEKAHALLLEHNLDMQSVKASGGTGDDYVKTKGFEARTRTTQQKFIIMLLQKFFFIRTVRSRTVVRGPFTLYFLGTKTNVAIAQYVHDFLNQKFPELWKEYKKANGLPESHKQSYYAGLALGLEEQLEASRTRVQNERGLVLVKDPNLEPFMNSQFERLGSGAMTKANIQNANAIEDGREEGRKLRIHKGIEAERTGNGTLRIGSRK